MARNPHDFTSSFDWYFVPIRGDVIETIPHVLHMHMLIQLVARTKDFCSFHIALLCSFGKTYIIKEQNIINQCLQNKLILLFYFLFHLFLFDKACTMRVSSESRVLSWRSIGSETCLKKVQYVCSLCETAVGH